MCTLIVMRHVFPDHPLVVASNRDEQAGRASAPAAWHEEEGKRIYAPTDLVRGGTWLGVSERGLFAAITNRDETPHQSGCASRGRLVTDALRAPNVRAAASHVAAALIEHRYNGFHLVIVDVRDAFLCVGYEHRVEVERMGDGISVVTGYGTTRSHVPRTVEIERRFEEIVCSQGPTPTALDALLNFHADHRPRDAACVHDPDESHQTVSSMLVRADRDWSRFEIWERNGPACSGPFVSSTVIPISRMEHRS